MMVLHALVLHSALNSPVLRPRSAQIPRVQITHDNLGINPLHLAHRCDSALEHSHGFKICRVSNVLT